MESGFKRSWNWSLWIGFLCSLAGLGSYVFFSQFPVTRDFPWANLLLFLIAAVFLGHGLIRAFAQPEAFRGKVFGPVLAAASLLVFAFFSYGALVVVRQIPASAGAPRVGQKAPEFTLPDQNGRPVALADLISSNKGVLLIFYRGYW